jgi:hypothetical protein
MSGTTVKLLDSEENHPIGAHPYRWDDLGLHGLLYAWKARQENPAYLLRGWHCQQLPIFVLVSRGLW